MRRAALLLPLLALTACAGAPPPETDLVPAGALTGLLPDSVGAFEVVGDEVYRGYFADGRDAGGAEALALVTAARTYRHGALLLTLSASSMDRPERYRTLVDSGERAAADSLLRVDPSLRAATGSGWTLYAVPFGWVLLHPEGRAVEAKSLASDVAREALGAVDLARLLALAEAPVTVDTSFVQAMLRTPTPAQAPAPSGGVIG